MTHHHFHKIFHLIHCIFLVLILQWFFKNFNFWFLFHQVLIKSLHFWMLFNIYVLYNILSVESQIPSSLIYSINQSSISGIQVKKKIYEFVALSFLYSSIILSLLYFICLHHLFHSLFSLLIFWIKQINLQQTKSLYLFSFDNLYHI